MVVDDRLEEIIKRYSLDVTTETKTHSVAFVKLKSRHKTWLQLDVQYVNNEIYCVYFLNNEFFEIEDERLYDVLRRIIEGHYSIKKTMISKKHSIQLVSEGHIIYPERTTSDKDYKDIYRRLPVAF